MSPVQKKKTEEDKGKDAEYNNKHCRDRKKDRMCTLGGGSCWWYTRTKRKLTLHYKQKDSKTNVEKLRRKYNVAGCRERKIYPSIKGSWRTEDPWYIKRSREHYIQVIGTHQRPYTWSVRKVSDLWPGKRNWLTWSVGHLITLKVVPLGLHTLFPVVPPLLEACRKSLFRNGV